MPIDKDAYMKKANTLDPIQHLWLLQYLKK